ncbi:MAG: transposase [Acetobacteraceae bacterium]|nr:transposase [Acetobacteraceae bacterium]
MVVLGIRRDGQKLLIAVRNMGGESESAWRDVLDDLVARGLRTPEFLIIDGAAGLEKALAALWPKYSLSAAQCINIAIFWRTRLIHCTTRSPPTTTT